MKVVLKKPGLDGEVIEVENLQAINKICGNVDENGDGWNRTSSDIRMQIAKGVDMFVKSDAINNFELEENMWTPWNNAVLFGNIVFSGYDENAVGYGVCSLNDEQIKTVFEYIEKQKVTHMKRHRK